MLRVLAVSCLVCLAAIPLMRTAARSMGLVDVPDGRRKTHRHSIPLVGGIGIFLAVFLALGLECLWSDEFLQSFASLRWLGLAAAATFILTLGVADDLRQIRGRHKLAGQIGVALALTQFGWVIPSVQIFGATIDLGLMATPFTVLWFLAVINSFNLLDGMDGFLGFVALAVCGALAVIGIWEGRLADASVAMALAGAVIGFLRYNLPPASVFLGDSGSMLLGLVVGAVAIDEGSGGTTSVPILIPAVLLTIPFFDTSAALLRRWLTGRSLFSTDRGHLHHCLLKAGFSPVLTLACVLSLGLVAAVFAVAGRLSGIDAIAPIGSGLIIVLLVASRLFGFMEFQLVQGRLKELALSMVQWRAVQPRRREVRLQGSLGWSDLWRSLIAGCRDLNLARLHLDVNAPSLHEGFHAHWEIPHEDDEHNMCWRAEFPLKVAQTTFGRLEVVGFADEQPLSRKMDDLLNLIKYFEAEAADFFAEESSVETGVDTVADIALDQPLDGPSKPHTPVARGELAADEPHAATTT